MRLAGSVEAALALAAASLANRMAPRDIGASLSLEETLRHVTAACAKEIAGCGSAVKAQLYTHINLIKSSLFLAWADPGT